MLGSLFPWTSFFQSPFYIVWPQCCLSLLHPLHFTVVADQKTQTCLCTHFNACYQMQIHLQWKKKHKLRIKISGLVAPSPFVTTLLSFPVAEIPEGGWLLITHIFLCATSHMMSWHFILPPFHLLIHGSDIPLPSPLESC